MTAQTPETPARQSTVFLSVDDDNNVLELGLSDQSGVYIRSSGAWFKLPNDDTTFDDKVWQDVDDSAIPVFDQADAKGTRPPLSTFQKYFITTSK